MARWSDKVHVLGPPLSPSPRLTELITDRLLGLMQSGHLKEGARLPAERELAGLLGVSRTMVREALAALQLAGLVERRPGAGTIVTRAPASSFQLQDAIEAGASVASLIDARMAADLGVAHLLCDGRAYDVGEARELLEAMRHAVVTKRKPGSYLPPSIEFHLALARATERPLVTAMQESLLELMRPHLWILAQKYDLALARRSLALHERILAAVDARDLLTALAEVKSHYSSYPALAAPPPPSS
jgi:DNA-binding FadR family transcriptional regulator